MLTLERDAFENIEMHKYVILKNYVRDYYFTINSIEKNLNYEECMNMADYQARKSVHNLKKKNPLKFERLYEEAYRQSERGVV